MKADRNQINTIKKSTNVFLNIFFIFWVLCCVIPLILIISTSLSTETDLALKGYQLIPSHITLDAYRYVLADYHKILNAYSITIIVTVVGTFFSVLLTTLMAYPLSRSSFRYKGAATFFIVFPMLFNGGLVPWYMVYSKMLHMSNTIQVLIIPLLVSPFYILILRTFFRTTIHESVLESARIDGAGEFRTFLSIVLPLSKPGIATIALFSTVGYWNDWYLSFIFITNDKIVNIQYFLCKVQSSIDFIASNTQIAHLSSQMNTPNQSARMAMCIVGVGPIVLAYPFFQKYFISGLTIGSVKG